MAWLDFLLVVLVLCGASFGLLWKLTRSGRVQAPEADAVLKGALAGAVKDLQAKKTGAPPA